MCVLCRDKGLNGTRLCDECRKAVSDVVDAWRVREVKLEAHGSRGDKIVRERRKRKYWESEPEVT